MGGGPAERAARARSQTDAPTDVFSRYGSKRWRRLMSSGRVGRLRARLGSMLGFPLSSIRHALASDSESVVVPTTNPFILPLIMVLTRPLHGRRVVPLVYDLYPDAIEASGLARGTGRMSDVLRALNRYWFARADGVVFIGEKMAEHCRRTYGEPMRWTVIETGADTAEFAAERIGPATAESELEQWCEERTVVSYVGSLGHVHDWETIAQAVPQLVAKPRAGRRIGVLIAASGPGVDYWKRAWADLPRDIVRFEHPLDDRAWARALARSDIALVSLKPEANRTSIPSKTFSAMAARNAVLVIAPRDSDVADVVETNACGAVITPGDVDAMVDTLESWFREETTLERLRTRSYDSLRMRYDIPRLAERWSAFLEDLGGSPPAAYERHKRALDVVCASAGLCVTAPVLALAALAVRATMGAGVFFRQERAGLNGDSFHILKLRTMKHPTPGQEGPDYDGERLTALGRFLRATSIDELPALWNVLRGDMSLVGPRPLPIRYLPRYNAEQARRHDVVPGVTGWAQIHGRNETTWAARFERDIWYVENRRMWLDAHILWCTVFKVLGRSGTSHSEHATMEEFTGTEVAARA